MTVRRILTAEDPTLRTKSKKVTRFGTSLKRLVDDMFETMLAAHGLGLAAPQIGALQRVFVVETAPEFDEEGHEVAPGERYVLVNPEIVKARAEEEMDEACLSVPGYRGLVRRATDVTVKGQDVEGHDVRYRVQALLAQAFQHELDHLDGVLYLDRLESPDKLWRVEIEAEGESREGPPAGLDIPAEPLAEAATE